MSDLSKPRVSVCIPSYNHEKYIGACIESVLNQTFQDFEIVITDDCSNDGSVELVKRFNDPRIRLFESRVNQGPSCAANNNIRNSRGEFLCLVASDDLFRPHKLERQLSFLEDNPNVAAAFTYMRYVNEAGVELTDHPGYRWHEIDNHPREGWLRQFFETGNRVAAPTVMIRRAILEKVGVFDPRLLQTQDFDLWIRVCLESDIHVIPERLVDYRIRDQQSNTSASTPRQQSQVHWELARVFENYTSISDRDFFCRIFPNAKDQRYQRWPLHAVLADIALSHEAPHLRAFGVELLYRTLGNEENARLLGEEGFTFPHFFRTMADADVFGIIKTSQVHDTLEETRAVLHKQTETADRRMKELADEVAFWMQRCNRTLDVRLRNLVRKVLRRL